MRFLFALLGLSFLAFAQQRPAYVIFSTPPVVDHLASRHPGERVRNHLFTSEADTLRASLRAEKADLVTRLQQRGVIIEHQTETVLNSILIEATAEDLAWVRTQPGVVSAEFSPIIHAH